MANNMAAQKLAGTEQLSSREAVGYSAGKRPDATTSPDALEQEELFGTPFDQDDKDDDATETEEQSKHKQRSIGVK